MIRIDLKSIIYLIGLTVILIFVFRIFWPLLIILAIYLLYQYLKARMLIKSAEKQMRKELGENISVEQQLFQSQVHQNDVIDAEYVEHKEQNDVQ
ncbi:MAG: hypothetical protein IKG15_07890 [Solobacterium sp.]|nr:hypothetical protein [Solobacterium sp.]